MNTKDGVESLQILNTAAFLGDLDILRSVVLIPICLKYFSDLMDCLWLFLICTVLKWCKTLIDHARHIIAPFVYVHMHLNYVVDKMLPKVWGCRQIFLIALCTLYTFSYSNTV